jgi:uncharacterized protein YndB with AHSA1/START domain
MRPKVLEAGPQRVRLAVAVPGRAPEEVFSYWVEPEKLCRWWPPEAAIDLRPQGSYVFSWPRMQQKLTGQWTRIEPGASLEFSWTWEHEPEVTKQVRVTFRRSDAGTEVEVEHGPYSAERRDAELRQEHLDGWTYFLGRLADAAAAPVGPPA